MDIKKVDKFLLRWSQEGEPLTVSEIARLWRCTHQNAAQIIRGMREREELDVCSVRRVSHTGQRQSIRAFTPTAMLVRRRTDIACVETES